MREVADLSSIHELDESYIDILDFLGDGGGEGGSLFTQREGEFERLPFDTELTLYRFVSQGQPREMIAFYRRMLIEHPNLRIPIGKTSRDRLRQQKYAAVAAIAMACRAAICGGVVEAVAFAKSDDSILLIDEAVTALDVLRREVQTLIEYAQMVQQSRSQLAYSPVVRSCIEYITVHSHGSITLDELALGTPYTKEYIAKLFRKEVGVPVSEYMLKVRIDEAKALLAQGQSCSEAAYTLGFTSQSYFNRQFKKVTGMTPKTYLAAHNSGDTGAILL